MSNITDLPYLPEYRVSESKKKSETKHARIPQFGLLDGVAVIIVGLFAWSLSVYSTDYESNTNAAECRSQIIGFQQLGYYTSPEDYRAAESYCHL